MNTNRHIWSLLAFCVMMVGCTSSKWVLTDIEATKIAIDGSVAHLSNSEMQHLITPYKVALDKEMDVVVGESLQEMDKGKPESLLSNWNADVYRDAASDFLRQSVDVAIVNMGGLRAKIPQGNITVRDVFQLMPFENELVILWLSGEQLMELATIFAQEGGQGVSGMRFEIVNKRVQHLTVGGKPIESKRQYTVATNDYLAAGNDRMTPLAKATQRVNTGLKLRNIVMAYIIGETQQGKKISATLDGRIVDDAHTPTIP